MNTNSEELQRQVEEKKIEIGKNIRKRREKMRYSQRELAELCGVTKSYILKLEHGERSPSLEMLIKLADIFDIKPSSLMRGI